MGSKNWAAAEVVNASDFNAFLANQVVMVFADATARDAGFGGTGEPTLAEGMSCFLSDVNQLQIYTGSAWVSVADTDSLTLDSAGDVTMTGDLTVSGDIIPSSALSGRNVVWNPDMKINQRNGAASGGPSAAVVLDGWKSYATTSLNYNVGAFTVGSPAAAGYSSPNYASLVLSGQSAVGDYCIFYHPIENVATLAGATVTLSFYAKVATGTPTIAVGLDQRMGTGGAGSVNTLAGQATLSTSWERHSLTVTLPSISGATIGTGDHLRVRFWLSAGSTHDASTGGIAAQNNTFDIWGIQVERGSNATPLEVRSDAEELARCQRYYQRYTSTGGDQAFAAGVFLSGTLPLCSFTFPPMRASPTFTFAGVYDAVGAAAAWTMTGTNAANMTTSTAQLAGTISGGTAGQGAVMRQDSGYFELSAEL